MLVNPDIKYTSLPRVEILQLYEHRAQYAHYSKRRLDQLRKDYFPQAWGGGVVVTHILGSLPDPIKNQDAQSHTVLDRHLTRHIKTYGIKVLLSSPRSHPTMLVNPD